MRTPSSLASTRHPLARASFLLIAATRTLPTTKEPAEHARHPTLHALHLLVLELLLFPLQLLQPLRTMHLYLLLKLLIPLQAPLPNLVAQHLPLLHGLDRVLLAWNLHHLRRRLHAQTIAQRTPDARAADAPAAASLLLRELLGESFPRELLAAVEFRGYVRPFVGFEDFTHVLDGHAGDVL